MVLVWHAVLARAGWGRTGTKGAEVEDAAEVGAVARRAAARWGARTANRTRVGVGPTLSTEGGHRSDPEVAEAAAEAAAAAAVEAAAEAV